jgi:hypothetical protein
MGKKALRGRHLEMDHPRDRRVSANDMTGTPASGLDALALAVLGLAYPALDQFPRLNLIDLLEKPEDRARDRNAFAHPGHMMSGGV